MRGLGWNRIAELPRPTLYRPRPMPPRAVRARSGSMEATVFWNAPADRRGIAGYRIYIGSEKNLVQQIDDPNARQHTVKLPAGTRKMCFVSTVSGADRESPRIEVVVESNTDKYLQNGQPGESSGVSAPVPPEWHDEPTGGKPRRYQY